MSYLTDRTYNDHKNIDNDANNDLQNTQQKTKIFKPDANPCAQQWVYVYKQQPISEYWK